MEYFNIKTKEIRFFKDSDFKLLDDKELWLDYSIIKNKIVLLTINGYKIFPKDELGLNRAAIMKFIEFSQPATIDSAEKIARYYKVCPYCSKPLEVNSANVIIDCRSNFSNIKKMQVDLYTEVSCCLKTYSIPFNKTLSNKAKAEFIKENLERNAMVIILYKRELRNIEVFIDFNTLIEHCKNKDIDINGVYEYLVLGEIIKNDLYMYIKKNGDIVCEDIDKIKMEVLTC